MLGMFRRLTLVTALVLVTASCKNGVKTTTDYQVERMDQARERYHDFSKDMTGSALLRDMSLSDAHFIPHSSELNGLGASRLDRMAPMLDTYGGTVRYQTVAKDEALVKQRLDHIREYLKLTGCKMERVNVAVAMAGGHGIPGDEAIEKLKRGTAVPQQQSSGTTINIGGATSPGGG